jgi:hypothetical protein
MRSLTAFPAVSSSAALDTMASGRLIAPGELLWKCGSIRNDSCPSVADGVAASALTEVIGEVGMTMAYQLRPPFEIYHDGLQIADMNGHLCSAEDREIAKAIVDALQKTFPNEVALIF